MVIAQTKIDFLEMKIADGKSFSHTCQQNYTHFDLSKYDSAIFRNCKLYNWFPFKNSLHTTLLLSCKEKLHHSMKPKLKHQGLLRNWHTISSTNSLHFADKWKWWSLNCISIKKRKQDLCEYKNGYSSLRNITIILPLENLVNQNSDRIIPILFSWQWIYDQVYTSS